jgi:signal transduction histidine kinase
MKLVRRLTVHLLLVIGVAVAIETYLGVRHHLALFDQDVRRDERLLGRALSHAVENAWLEHGEARARELIDAADALEDGVQIRLVLFDAAPGSPLAPGAPAVALQALAERLRVAHARDEQGRDPKLFTYVPLAIPGHPSAGLEISEWLPHERAYAATRVRQTLVTAALTVIACGLTAWFVGVRLVGRPIAGLVEKARRIGAGDFTGRLALSHRDELSLLAAEMNAMAERLDAATRRVASESAARIAALEQLRHADRLTTVGELAAGLAHELGTPLNVVSGRAQMIASGETKDPAEAVECARIIHHQAERMAGIVRQLLDFARRRGSQKLPADVAALARQTTSLLEPLAVGRGVELVCESAAASLRARLDPSGMQQALTNLIVNGIQATKGRGRVRVRTLRETLASDASGGRTPGDYVVLEVGDEGEGIPAEQLASIFDPFFTTKEVGEGTGLGLSVAHTIVQEHGGWIEVESQPDRGSRFRIWIPAEAA